MEEYLNSLKTIIGYHTACNISDNAVHLDVIARELSAHDFYRIKELLKTWTFMYKNTYNNNQVYVYSFVHYNLKQEIREIGLSNLI